VKIAVALAVFAGTGAALGACALRSIPSEAAGASTGLGSSSEGTGAGGAATSTSSSPSSSSTTSTATTGAGGAPTECAGAVSVLASDGADSGFAKCPDGTIHRNFKAICDPSVGVVACTGTEKVTTCTSDSECVAHPHGRCAQNHRIDFSGLVNACDCVYPCASDAECDPDHVCVCADVVSADNPRSLCAPATCASGHDCPSGECGLSGLRLYAFQCLANVQLACRAPADACRADAECATPGDPTAVCALVTSPAWQCAGPVCATN
jgi:hypothetical protein